MRKKRNNPRRFGKHQEQRSRHERRADRSSERRPERKPEYKPEHKSEHRPEHRPEHRQERRPERKEHKDRYWVYGRHAVFSALESERIVHRLWVTGNVLSQEQSALHTMPYETKTAEEIAYVLPREAVHQGIAAEISKLPEKALEDIDVSNMKCVVVLDQVTDPHNAGAIFRSAAAFDVGAVIVPRHGSVNETATMAKAASGALDIVPLITVNNLARSLEELKEAGFWIIGLDGDAETEIGAMPDYEKVVLVLGSEGKGLRRLTAELCDLLVKIPMGGKMESLNVSNAAAVAFYILSQR